MTSEDRQRYHRAMPSQTITVASYLKALPDDRRAAMTKLRKVVKANLPKGFKEVINYGMPGYVVLHSLYPQGYHCDAAQPLPFAAIASTKGHIGGHAKTAIPVASRGFGKHAENPVRTHAKKVLRSILRASGRPFRLACERVNREVSSGRTRCPFWTSRSVQQRCCDLVSRISKNFSRRQFAQTMPGRTGSRTRCRRAEPGRSKRPEGSTRREPIRPTYRRWNIAYARRDMCWPVTSATL